MRRRRNPYSLLLAMRFRFYATGSGRLFLRHWQWFLLAGLLVPGLPVVSMFEIPGHLFAAIASPSLGSIPRAGLLLAVQLVAMVWILPQLDLLRGGAFRSYAETLPLTRLLREGVTCTLLCVADALILIPATAGFLEAMPSTGGLVLFRTVALFAVASNLLLLQLGIVEQRAAVTLAATAGSWPLCMALTAPAHLNAWFLLLFAVGCPVAVLCAPDRFHARLRARVRLVSSVRHVIDARLLGRVPASLRVQWKVLAEAPIGSCALFCAALGVAEGVDVLLSAFSYDGRSLPAVITGMAAAALIVGGLYRRLRQAHASAAEFCSALPLGRHFWAVRDVLVLISLGWIPMVMLLFPLVRHGLASALVVLVLGAGYLALLSGLRLTAAPGGRFSVMASVALAVVWASVAMAATVR